MFAVSVAGSQQQRYTYTGDELEYFYFVHAINIVGRILMYKQGLKLFPVKIKGYEGEKELWILFFVVMHS